MAGERKLIVQVIGDDSGLQKTLSNATRSIQKFGKDTQRTGGVSTINSRETQAQLADWRKRQDAAEDFRDKMHEVGDESEIAGRRIERALKIGAGFFALGRGLEGAGKGLEVIQGHASSASNALNDAGGAIQSLITLDPDGFFESVGASAARTRDGLNKYAGAIVDANTAGRDLQLAQGARALGFEKEAKAIEAAAGRVRAAAAAINAIEFAQRKENVTTVDGQTRLVRFRGAGANEDAREFGGAGGVELNRNVRQPIQVTVEIDGEAVGRTTRKSAEKNSRRNPRQKRGPNIPQGD